MFSCMSIDGKARHSCMQSLCSYLSSLTFQHQARKNIVFFVNTSMHLMQEEGLRTCRPGVAIKQLRARYCLHRNTLSK